MNHTGLSLEAFGELEYYVIYEKQPLYPVLPQRGYEESSPFTKLEKLRCEAMRAIAQAGGTIKYGHTEVGNMSVNNLEMEQHEIEFLPMPIEDAADQLVVAKWMLRMIGYKYGVTISFAPKIMVGHAGNGLHIHTKLVKDRNNVMVENGELSDIAKKAITGYLTLAQSLTALGNTIPASYLRLVPNQEAPTNICWGDRNRSALVRVPLGWIGVSSMIKDANPLESANCEDNGDYQTVEFRSPDGSADIHLLLAGLAVSARHGLEMDNALNLSEKFYVPVNIFNDENKKLKEKFSHLPASCWESADFLLKDREIYQKDSVFTPVVIDGVVKKLKSYNDLGLSEKLYQKENEIQKLVNDYIHCA